MWLFRKPNLDLDEQKNQAYLIYAEWGPKLRIPREQRLGSCFPHISRDTRAAWIAEFKRIDSEVWKVAEEGGAKSCTLEVFKVRMTQIFPFMNQDALSKAWFLASYYAWHDGYDTST